MKRKEEILNTGTLYWFKSNRRGEVAIPLHYLTDVQKKTLYTGLKSSSYKLCNPNQFFTAHYMWRSNHGGYFLVTDIEISLEVKRKISPTKPVRKKPSSPYRMTLSDMKRLLEDLSSNQVDELFVEKFISDTSFKPWVKKEWKSKRAHLIQNSCEYCGSQEKLILQHEIQPRKIHSILYDLVGERYDEEVV